MASKRSAGSRLGRAVMMAALAGTSAACVMERAVVPTDIRSSAARLPLHSRFWHYSGGSLDGLQVVSFRDVPPPPELRDPNLFRATRWKQFGLRDGSGLAWTALCSETYTSRREPASTLVCTYEPERSDLEPLTLVLVSDLMSPWSGSFFSGDVRFDLVGTSEIDNVYMRVQGFDFHIGTAGLRVLRDDASLGFVEVMTNGRQEAWLLESVDRATRLRLRPLFLTFGIMSDVRGLLDEAPDVRVSDFQMPDPVDRPPFTPFVRRLLAEDRLWEAAALTRHLPGHVDLQTPPPLPAFGPDGRAERKKATFDFIFPGLTLSAPIATEIARADAADFRWTFGYPIYFGTTLFDWVHLGASAEYSTVRPDAGSVPLESGLEGFGAGSDGWRFAVGGRLTLLRAGIVRPYVGADFIASRWAAGLSIPDTDAPKFNTSAWGFGVSPAFGVRWVFYDAGRSRLEVVTEVRMDVTDWSDAERDFDPALTSTFTRDAVEAWLDRIEANRSSLSMGTLVALVFRI